MIINTRHTNTVTLRGWKEGEGREERRGEGREEREGNIGYLLASGQDKKPVQDSGSCWVQERVAVVRGVWSLHSAGAGRRCESFSLQGTVRLPATSPGDSC